MAKAEAIQLHALTRSASLVDGLQRETWTSVIAPLRASVGFLITAVLLIVAWWSTFFEMWLRWFPGWRVHGLGLVDRLSLGGSYYGHAILVPAISAIMAATTYRLLGMPTRRTRGASVVGWIVLAGFLCLHLISVHARVTFVSGFALIGVLVGLVLIWGGRPLLRAYRIPIGLLVFMVPLPMVWIADLNLVLKTQAIRVALWAVVDVLGIPAVMDGSFVYLSPHASGSPQVLVVGSVCSGLRNLIAAVWFASLFVTVCRIKGAWRWALLVAAGPVAVAANVLRIAVLIVVANYWGVRAAGPASWFHNFSAVVVFVVAIGLLVGLERWIIRLGRWLRRDWARPGRWVSAPPVRPSKQTAPATLRPMPLTVPAATAALSLGLSARHVRPHAGDHARQAIPRSLTVGGRIFMGLDLDLHPRTLAILETNDYVLRRYTSLADGRVIDLLIVLSTAGRKGSHPPEVCLEGHGETLARKQYLDLGLEPGGGPRVCELVMQQKGLRTYHLYLYKCGDGYTTSFMSQQARIFLNGLVGRKVSGALIRVNVPAVRGDGEAARRLARESLRMLMPHIDKGLP